MLNIKTSKRTIKQFTSLLFSSYLLIIISFITNIFMTHSMQEVQFGYYRYAISIISMVVTFINGGFYFSAARLVAINEENEENSIISTTILLMVSISIIFTILGIIIIFIINNTWLKIDPIVFWTIPFVFALLIQRTFIIILKGNNKIKQIIEQTILPQLLILILYFTLSINKVKIDYKYALIIYGSVFAITHIITWKRLHLKVPPNIIGKFKVLLDENKVNGFQLYKGSIAGVLIGEILTVIVGGTIEKALFGMYSLAISISSPIASIPQAMATIKFRENSRIKKMSNKNIVLTITVSITGLLVLNIGVKGLFPVFFESRYDEALNFLLLCSIRFLIHGLGDYFNQFLASHGLGKQLRNGAYISGSIQLLTAVMLIPKFGIYGMIISNISTSVSYLVTMVFIYHKFTKKYN